MNKFTKILSLFLALLMVVFSFTACQDLFGKDSDENDDKSETKELTPEERFEAANKTMENIQKFEVDLTFDSTTTVKYGAESESMRYVMSMNMKGDGTNPDNLLLSANGSLKMPDLGISVAMEMYMKDGYTYTKALEEKTKELSSQDINQEKDPITLAFEALDTAVYTENEDGSLTVKVTLSGKENKDAFIDMMMGGTSFTKEDIQLCKVNDVDVVFTIDKDNKFTEISFPVSISLDDDMGTDLSVSYTMSLSFISTSNDIELVFPDDLDTYVYTEDGGSII